MPRLESVPLNPPKLYPYLQASLVPTVQIVFYFQLKMSAKGKLRQRCFFDVEVDDKPCKLRQLNNFVYCKLLWA